MSPPDNKVLISDVVKKTVFQQTMTMDYSTMTVDTSHHKDNKDYYGTDMQFKLQNPILSYILQFLSTCIPTLIIEGFVLLLFGFSMRRNFKLFLKVNIGTQLLLTLVTALAGWANVIYVMILMIPLEMLIVFIEAKYYARWLVGKSRTRSIVYAVCANLISAVAGFYIIGYEYIGHFL